MKIAKKIVQAKFKNIVEIGSNDYFEEGILYKEQFYNNYCFLRQRETTGIVKLKYFIISFFISNRNRIDDIETDYLDTGVTFTTGDIEVIKTIIKALK